MATFSDKSEPLRVFIGFDDRQLLSLKVLQYSVNKGDASLYFIVFADIRRNYDLLGFDMRSWNKQITK